MVVLLGALLALLQPAAAPIAGCSAAGGSDGLNLRGGDLAGSPHPLTAPAAAPSTCAAMCNATAGCKVWTFHTANCTPGSTGPHPLCWLKGIAAMHGRSGNPCTCSGAQGGGALPAAPPAPPPAPPPHEPEGCPLREQAPPPKGARNVLYILVDDLRPSLSPYGQTQVRAARCPRPARCSSVHRL